MRVMLMRFKNLKIRNLLVNLLTFATFLVVNSLFCEFASGELDVQDTPKIESSTAAVTTTELGPLPSRQTSETASTPEQRAPQAKEVGPIEGSSQELAAGLTQGPLDDRNGFELWLSHEGYLTSRENLGGLSNNYERLNARVWMQGDGRVTGGLDATVSVAANSDRLGYFSIPEVYLKTYSYANYKETRSQWFVFGRKLEEWSRVDSYWKLGVTQPLFSADLLRPQEQGFVGLFLNLEIAPNLQFMGLYSPVFIPEQGPPFEVRNNKILSPSPWFSSPTNSFVLYNGTADIFYSVNTPSIMSIVRKETKGARVLLGHLDDGAWLKMSYMQKPRNQLRLPFEGQLNLTGSSSVARVDIFPRVVFHQTKSIDFGYDAKAWSFWFSWLRDEPTFDKVDSLLTAQTLSQQELFSPALQTHFSIGEKQDLKVSIAYLEQKGGEWSEVGPLATADGNIFTPPMTFSHAWKTELFWSSRPADLGGNNKAASAANHDGVAMSKKWTAAFSFLKDLVSSSQWASADLAWFFNARWNTHFGFDIISSDAKSTDANVLSRFRANDRYLLDVRYVF